MGKAVFLALVLGFQLFAATDKSRCPKLTAKLGTIATKLQAALDKDDRVLLREVEALVREALRDMDESGAALIESFDSELDREMLRRMAFDPIQNIPALEFELAQLVDDLSVGIDDLPITRSRQKALAAQIDAAIATPRAALAVAAREEAVRKYLVQNRLQALNFESANLKRNLAQVQQNGGYNRTDILFVGGGVRELEAVNLLRQLPNALSMITTEKEPVPFSTFARGGKLFTTNSPSRPARTGNIRQVPNRLTVDQRSGGDLNFFPGALLQVRDFDSRPFPFAGDFAQAGQMSRGFVIYGDDGKPRYPIAFEEELVSIGPVKDAEVSADGTFPFRATYSSGLVLYPRAVVVSGIGKPRQQFASSTRVIRWEKFLEMSEKDPQGAFRLFNGKRVGVVGENDSGIAAVRFISGNRPEALGGTRSEGEGAAEILWYGQSSQTCEEFRNKVQSINADLGTLFRSGRVKARPRVTGVDGNDDQAGVCFIDPGTRNQIVEELDYVILADGYESNLPGFLSEFSSYEFRLVEVDEPGLGRVAIAKQLVVGGVPVNFFVIGPEVQEIVSERELAGLAANRVAIYNWNWRTWRLIALLEKALSYALPSSVVQTALPAPPIQPNLSDGTRTFLFRKITPLSLRGKPTAYRFEDTFEELEAALSRNGQKVARGARIRIEQDSGGLLVGSNQLTSTQGDAVARLLDTVINRTPVFLNWTNYQLANFGPIEIVYTGAGWVQKTSDGERSLRVELGAPPNAKATTNLTEDLNDFFSAILTSDTFVGVRIFLTFDAERPNSLDINCRGLPPQALVVLSERIRQRPDLFGRFAGRRDEVTIERTASGTTVTLLSDL